MSILIYTDPHQGLTLGANTTMKSRQRMKQSLNNTLRHVVLDRCNNPKVTAKVCAGDFYHKYQNPEEVILDSVPYAQATDVILGGNHDVTNDKDKFGSLELLNKFMPDKIVMPVFNECVSRVWVTEGNALWFVPHHSSKDLFEKSLEHVHKGAAERTALRLNILFLHCNYDSGYATQDTELNLTSERAKKLLEKFDYIVIGHDHHFKTDFDGRVIVLGSIHPTCFSDAGKHYVMEIDGADIKFHETWAGQVLTVDVNDLHTVDPTTTHFVKVTGFAEPTKLVDLTKTIKKMWDHPECSLFALKSEVKIVSNEAAAGASAGMQGRAKLTDIIERELENNPELLALWKEISHVEAA